MPSDNPVALFDYNSPPFDWNGSIPEDLLTTIANFGDLDMCLRVAASASINVETAQALLALGDERLAVALRDNPNVPRRVINMSLNVKRIAKIARRAAKREVRQAAKFRSSYVSLIGEKAAREMALSV